MKRTITSLVLAGSLLLVAPTASAMWKVCVSNYQGGELCYRACTFYDDNGNFMGSITEDYHC